MAKPPWQSHATVPSPWSYRSGGSGCRSPGPCPEPCDADCQWSRPPAPGSHPSHSPWRHLLPWNTQEGEAGSLIGQRLCSSYCSIIYNILIKWHSALESTMSTYNLFQLSSRTNKWPPWNSNIVTCKDKIIGCIGLNASAVSTHMTCSISYMWFAIWRFHTTVSNLSMSCFSVDHKSLSGRIKPW